MFFRLKKSGKRTYIQIVENKRIDGAVRQSVIANLGRAEEFVASDALASLLSSGAKLTDQVLLINAPDEDADGALSVSAKRIGGPLLFGRIWERPGIAEVLGDLLAERAFEFAALIGNSAYRRYLRKSVEAENKGDKRMFEIDAGKLAEEAQFDGIFVLRTNAKVTPLQAVLRYRDLLRVENLFLRTKAIMRTRPIFHSSDAAIRGHVFCSFLAPAMQKHLDDLSREAGVMLEWKQMLRDLDRLQQARLRYHGADWLLRTDATPMIAALFRHAPYRAAAARPANGSAEGRAGVEIRPEAPWPPSRSATSPRISPQPS